MFRSWFNTPTTIDTKPLAAKKDMTIDTTARHQGEKLFSTLATTTSPTTITTTTTTKTPMTTTANAPSTMTMMVSPKVPPTVKSTSVNVNMDDQISRSSVNNDSAVSSEFDSEPFQSASISLSIELAKKTSYSSLNSPSSVATTTTTATSKPIFMQKPDNVTPQSSLPKYITNNNNKHNERPSSIASHSSHSLLQRMAHSPKAAPATFSTSVSANGKNNSHQDNNENTATTSAVIESLSKQIHPPPPPPGAAAAAPIEDFDELTEQDIHNVATNTTTPTVSMSTTTDDEEEEMDHQQESQAQAQQKIDSSQSSTCENTTQKPSAAAAEVVVQEKGDQKVGGFWTWLGFPPSDSESPAVDTIATRGAAVATAEKPLGSKGEDTHQDEHRQLKCQQEEEQDTLDQDNTTTTTTTITTKTTPNNSAPAEALRDTSDQKTKTSSWSSFLFSSRPSSIHQQTPQQQKPAVPANQTLDASTANTTITTTNTNTTTQPAIAATADDEAAAASDANLRKVKSTSSLPSSPLSTTQTLRYSASISSFQQPPKKKNFVFPPFESQFLENDAAAAATETNTISASNASTATTTQNSSSSNLIIKAMDAINSILIPTPAPPAAAAAAAEEDSTSNWIAKRMRAKFSNFVDDIKQYTSTKDPVQSAMLDKRIVVVGVHGWFPMKLVRSMIGEPTGTSIKFCEQMVSGVKLYFESVHQVTLPDDAITMVPLEGEGKVEDRVNQLYTKLVDNSKWLEAVSSADVVLWATHSQGTPVSIMLLQRLLERGHIHVIRQSICVLAMAGISSGPFPALKGSLIVKMTHHFLIQYFEADAARELFEFMDSNSPISVKFRQSLAYVLKCGTKVVLTGSMQDQVVPLYSAIMSSVNHSSILRSIYIDGHVYSQDDFLINLIVFALRLRNSGLSDHDLLTHLSEVLAGSLYALEGGHSTIYEELEVYMTAIRYTFETAPFGKYTRRMSPSLQPAAPSPPFSTQPKRSTSLEDAVLDPFQAKQQQNPFYLPWALHAVCTDPLILADESLKQDLCHLQALFEQWNPTSARLRELKFRLDPLKTIKL
ncbi:hypothetical protein MBANPS3_004288 [Mucor bainieri]